jgi:DNA-binding transcriptional ArsR family regulator
VSDRPWQHRKRTSAANKRAQELNADLIDERLTKAIAHPLRLQILAVANEREISPSEYSEETGAPLSNVSYHFRKLYELDFIELTKEVPKGGSHEHRYIGSRRGLVTDVDWAKLGKTTQAGVRIAGFQDLITRCTQAVQAETFDSREDAVFYWIGGGMDETGWEQFTAALHELIKVVSQIEVDSVQRVANGEGNGEIFPTTFAVSGFESPKQVSKKERSKRSSKGKKSSLGS